MLMPKGVTPQENAAHALSPPSFNPGAQRAIDFVGGESAALGRLRHYLWDTRAVSTYFDTRNGMLGADYSTKFSPWLALGCISPRIIHHEVLPARHAVCMHACC